MLKIKKEYVKLGVGNLILIVFIILFVVVFSALFGSSNQLIGVALVTGILMFSKIGLGFKKNQSALIVFLICTLMGVCNILSFYNIYFSLVLNTIAVFVLMIFTVFKLEYKTFIPFILMYIFAQSIPIPNDEVLMRFLAFFISGIALALVIRFINKANDEQDIIYYLKGLKISKECLTFSIRMTIGVVTAMFFGDFLGLERTMWISITVMSLTQPHIGETHNRIRGRIKGTVIGFVLFILIFGFVPEQYLVYVTAILAYAYTFLKSYQIQMIFITVNSLNAAQGIFGDMLHSSIIHRISYIVLGIFIVLFIVFLEKRFFKYLESRVTLEED